jgi:hypothetical protein
MDYQKAKTYDQRRHAQYDGDERLFRTLFEYSFHRPQPVGVYFVHPRLIKIDRAGFSPGANGDAGKVPSHPCCARAANGQALFGL